MDRDERMSPAAKTTRHTMLRRTVAVAGIMAFSLVGRHAWAADQELTAAISVDIPPYVSEKATSGFEVELMRALLPDYKLKFVQMSYDELETAIEKGRADVSVCVLEGVTSDHGVFYSEKFISFYNYAISKKAAGLKIASVAELAGHPVLAWQDAYLELGDAFKKLFSPGSPDRKDYQEFANQREQVAAFWRADDAVVVIDGSIFRYVSAQQHHDPSAAVYHAIFPPNTKFHVAFRDAAVRDQFDRQLKMLVDNGEYQRLVDRYRTGPANADTKK